MVALLLGCQFPNGSGTRTQEPEKPEAPVDRQEQLSLLSSSDGAVVPSLLNMWDTKTSFTPEHDPLMGKVLKVFTDPTSSQANDWGTVLAFSNIDPKLDLLSNYSQLSFKIRSPDFSEIVLKFPEVEKKYALAAGTPLGGGWYQLKIPLVDFLSAAEPNLAIFQYKEAGSGAFFITDVEFSGDPIAQESLPAGGGMLYAPGNPHPIAYSDLSPWDAGSKLQEVSDPTQGLVLEVQGGSNWGKVQCLAIQGVGKLQKGIYYEDYLQLGFKIKVEGASQVEVYAKGLKRKYALSSGSSLGGGWYQITVPFTDLLGAFVDDGQIAFLAEGSFRITDVELSGTPSARPPLPPEGGNLFAPGQATAVTYGDISPWDAGSQLEEVQDAQEGTVLQASGGTLWGATQCLAFMGIGQVSQTGVYFEAYQHLSFKIRATGASQFELYAKGTKKVYALTSGTSLGSGWYGFKIAFADLTGTPKNDGQVAFLAAATFQITDVAFAP